MGEEEVEVGEEVVGGGEEEAEGDDSGRFSPSLLFSLFLSLFPSCFIGIKHPSSVLI